MAIVRLLGWIIRPLDTVGPFGLRIRVWMLRNLPGLVTCAELERFVIDYHDDGLSQTERRVFEIHLEMCPPCRSHFESYLKTIELGKLICAADEAEAPTELPEGLRRAILAARLAR